MTAPAKRPAKGAAAAALARLAGFGGWVDPAVSLPGVSERVLDGLVAAGSAERWRGLVRAIADDRPAAKAAA